MLGSLLDLGIGALKRAFTKKKGKRLVKGANEVVESIRAIREPGESIGNWEVILAYVVRMIVLIGLGLLLQWISKVTGISVADIIDSSSQINDLIPE